MILDTESSFSSNDTKPSIIKPISVSLIIPFSSNEDVGRIIVSVCFSNSFVTKFLTTNEDLIGSFACSNLAIVMLSMLMFSIVEPCKITPKASINLIISSFLIDEPDKAAEGTSISLFFNCSVTIPLKINDELIGLPESLSAPHNVSISKFSMLIKS